MKRSRIEVAFDTALQIYKTLSEKYMDLTSSPTRLLFLKGSDLEIGRAHAEQLKESVTQGMPVFYHDLWELLWSPPGLNASEKLAAGVARRFVDTVLVGKLLKSVPTAFKDRIRGMTEVAPLSFREMCTALVLPDLMPMLQAYLLKWRPLNFIASVEPTLFGCSSFISRGEKFLVGRNLDFPGVGYWDRYPVIQVFERPGKLKYIGIASSGVPIGGITGVNEAQIFVALHQHYGKEIDWRGQLPFAIAEEILATAQTLSQALEILKDSRLASSWAFVIADGKSRDGAIVEAHPKAVGIRRLSEKGKLAHSNYFQTTECRPSGYSTTGRMNWDNYCRKSRLQELIEAEELTVESGIRAISDHYDPYWGEEKIFNRTVSQLYNIQSLVIDVENMRLWFAEGAPPVHLGIYREYDLGELFAERLTVSPHTLPGFRFRSEEKAAAKRSLVQGFVSCFDGDFEGALEHSLQSLQSDFCPELAYVSALLYLKRREFKAGYDLLQQAREFIEKKKAALGKAQFPPEYFEILLFLARACRLLGRTEEAEKWYARLSGEPSLDDDHLRRLGRAKRMYGERDLSKIIMPYSSYIPLS